MSLPLHELEISLFLFSSWIFFIRDLQFSSYTYSAYLGVLLKIVLSSEFQIQLARCLYKGNLIYFCVLTCILQTCCKLLISSRSYYVRSLKSSTQLIISPASKDSFIQFCPICICINLLYCIIALVKSSNTVLSRSGERGYLCLISDLCTKASSSLPLSVMSAVGFLFCLFYMFFIKLKTSLFPVSGEFLS